MPDDTDNPPVIDYAAGVPMPNWVSVRKFLSDFEARLASHELEAHGIRHQIFNATLNALTAEGVRVPVDLQVVSDDLERAKMVLANHAAVASGDVEPAEPDDPAQPLTIADEEGNPARWAAAETFASARAMHEAAMVLESAHMAVLLPRLVPRGTGVPPGEGPRFVLRVQDDDVNRARALLKSAADDADEDEPHCPQCGSWSIHETTHEFSNMLLGLIGRSKPVECQCLKCHYVGKRGEFVR